MPLERNNRSVIFNLFSPSCTIFIREIFNGPISHQIGTTVLRFLFYPCVNPYFDLQTCTPQTRYPGQPLPPMMTRLLGLLAEAHVSNQEAPSTSSHGSHGPAGRSHINPLSSHSQNMLKASWWWWGSVEEDAKRSACCGGSGVVVKKGLRYTWRWARWVVTRYTGICIQL